MNDIEKPKERRWLLPLLSSLLASFTIGFFAPIDTYFTLASEVCFSATEFLPECLLAFAALFGVCFGLAMLLRGKARNIFCALLIGGSLALYLQGNFLNLDYGELNGADINWDAYGHYGRLNLVYWLLAGLAPLALLLIFKKRFIKIMRFACVFLALLMALSLGMQGLSGAGEPQRTNCGFLETDMFELSKQSNIVVFVVDTLDATTTESYLQSRPQIASKLDGFTLFPNSVSSANVTAYALPVLLTASAYGFETDYNQYIDDAWANAELYALLKQEGYRNYVYTDSQYASANTIGQVDNAALIEVTVKSHSKLLKQLGGIIAFRFAPHVLKKKIEVNAVSLQNNKILRTDDEKLYQMMEGEEAFFEGVEHQELRADLETPALHIYHLRGMHLPYVLGTDGKHDENANLGTSMDGYFAMLIDYLGQMRTLDIYDGATIVITGDHGSRQIDPNAALLVKRPGDSGTLTSHAALVSEMDIAKTIAIAAGLRDGISVGEDAFNSSRREAEYRDYFEANKELRQLVFWPNQQGKLCYNETGVCYSIRGVTNNVYSNYVLGASANLDSIAQALRWITPINVLYADPAVPGALWFGKMDAQLKVRLVEKGSGPLRLTLGIAAIAGDSQRLIVMNGGKVLAQTVIQEGDSEATLTLPDALRDEDVLSLTLCFPDATSQLSQNDWTSGERRYQGAAISFFRID